MYSTTFQKYERLHKAFGKLAEFYRPFGINFFYTNSKKLSNEHLSMAGKIVLYRPHLLEQRKERQSAMFIAGGKSEDDLR